MGDTSIDLWNRYRAGTPDVAEELFKRYVERLKALARSRLSRSLAARIDAEDVVQSAYFSFFRRAQKGEFAIHQSGDLWRLLATMTVRKLQGQCEFHRAAKRSIAREVTVSPNAARQLLDDVAASASTASEVVAAADELERLLASLSPSHARAVEMRLENYDDSEIATALGCSKRTVRRWLHEAKRLLEAQLDHLADQTGSSSLPGADIPHARLRHGDYLLQRQIGSGGMGRVYIAVEKKSGSPVAMKVLRKALWRNRLLVERFRDEAITLSRLEHPNIVRMHGVGEMPGGAPFIVMDLVDGSSLERFGSQELPLVEAVGIVTTVANAIEHAHSRGVIHCDLKPANVLIDHARVVRVVDFGMAQWLAPAAKFLVPGGTAAYMAPEQIDFAFGKPDERTDVFGLGGLLYFLIAGRTPHKGNSHEEILEAAVSPNRVVLPQELQNSLPHSISDIVACCLEKRPADRMAGAAQVSNALTAWLSKR